MARRNELARERGFRSYGEQRRYSGDVKGRAGLEALPIGARDARQQALDVIARARRDGVDIKTAAGREHVPVASVKFWAASAVVAKDGRLVASAADRMYRPMYVYAGGKAVVVDTRGSRVASTVGAYHDAVRRYLETGDRGPLSKFEGKRIAGVTLDTDPVVLMEMARADDDAFESIYKMVEQ